MTTRERRTGHRSGDIHLGLRDERVKLGDHIAYFWENPFYVGVDEFLERMSAG